RAARREPVGEDQPARVERVEIDPAGLAFHEAREIVDVNPRRLDAQQVLQRQGIAALLERENDFAGAEIGDEAREVVDRRPRNSLLDDQRALVHADVADDNETAAGLLAELLQPQRTGAGAQYQHAPAERAGAENPADDHAVGHQQQDREPHRVKQSRAPEGASRENEIEEGQRDDRETHGDEKPGAGEAQRAQRLVAVDPDRDHRREHDGGETTQRRQTHFERLRIHADLRRPKRPGEVAGHEQQDAVDQAEKQDRVRDVVTDGTNTITNQPHTP